MFSLLLKDLISDFIFYLYSHVTLKYGKFTNLTNFKVMKLSFITLNYAHEVSFYGVIGVARICHMIVWGRAGNQIQ